MWRPSNVYSGWTPSPSSDELYHHGIMGMQWGHRNGPPYPLDSGDHSASEKKAGWRKSLGSGSVTSNKKMQKQAFKELRKVAGSGKSDRFEMTTAAVANKISKAQQQELTKRFDAWKKATDIEDEFYESDERTKASAKAYDDTFNYFKKNDPDYLNHIITMNNGHKDDLDGFHDFRKVYEGFEDERWSEALDKYKKKKGITSDADALWKEYNAAVNDTTRQLIGKNGKKSVSWTSKYKMEDAINRAIDDNVTNGWRTRK